MTPEAAVSACFDPVAGVVYAGREGEPPTVEWRTDGLLALHYQEKGVLVLHLACQAAELEFLDLDGRPQQLALDREGGRWRVRVGT